MKISESIRKFEFHDASVDTITYSSEAQLLEITLTFSDWVQDMENRIGQLVFYGVDFLKSDPLLETLQWDGSIYGDVIEFKHYPALDRNTLEGVRIVIELRSSQGSFKELLIVELAAPPFEWLPKNGD